MSSHNDCAHILDEQFLSSHGVVDWGYTETSTPLSFKYFKNWIEASRQGPLHYLSDHRMRVREELKNFYPEFKSGLVFLFSYSDVKKHLNEFYKSSQSNGLKFASYVFGFEGQDYHHVLKERLQRIAQEVQKNLSMRSDFKISLDMHPVLERDLAYRSGLGWFGKNSMLISKKHGSYTLIGSILFDQKLPLSLPQNLEADHCGHCTACVQACPTSAIDPESRQLIANQCISTFTIELFKPSDEIQGHAEKSNGEIFGCDICQEVCPWNFRPLQNNEPKRDQGESSNLIKETFLTPSIDRVIEKLESMSNKEFVRVFKKTPLARTGKKGLLKNLKVFKK